LPTAWAPFLTSPPQPPRPWQPQPSLSPQRLAAAVLTTAVSQPPPAPRTPPQLPPPPDAAAAAFTTPPRDGPTSPRRRRITRYHVRGGYGDATTARCRRRSYSHRPVGVGGQAAAAAAEAAVDRNSELPRRAGAVMGGGSASPPAAAADGGWRGEPPSQMPASGRAIRSAGPSLESRVDGVVDAPGTARAPAPRPSPRQPTGLS